MECRSNENLEYDHIIPISKGDSNTERNVQLLYMNSNRKKRAKIMRTTDVADSMLHSEKKDASLELQAALDYIRRTGNAPPFAERRVG